MKASKAQLEASRRWYEKNKVRILAMQTEYRKSPAGRAVQAKKDKKTQMESPEKWSARNAVWRAVNNGDIRKPDFCNDAKCRECTGLEAHHYLGYAKKNWLDVVYLCKKHHIAAHKVIGNIHENPTLLI